MSLIYNSGDSTISADGSAADVDLTLTPKGAGNLILDGMTFPNADGTVDQVLSTNGAGVLAWADGGGGGGPELFFENASNPNSVTVSGDNNVQIGDGYVSWNAGSHDFFVQGSAPTAQNTNTVGAVGRGAILGGYKNKIEAYDSAIIGGTQNTISAGGNGFIGGGNSNTIRGSDCAAVGCTNIADSSSNYEATMFAYVGANGCRSRKTHAVLPASARKHGIALGNSTEVYNDLSIHLGMKVSNVGPTYGSNQMSISMMGTQTTDATQKSMTMSADNVDSFAENGYRMQASTDCVWGFEIVVVARRTDADNESAMWKGEFAVDVNAGTMAAVGTLSNLTSVADDSSGTWTVIPVVDAVNKTVKIKVTGEASKTIRWSGKLTATQLNE